MTAEYATMQRSGLLSRIKASVMPAGARPRSIPLGLYRGLRLEIDFHSQTQIFLGLWERETHRLLRDALGRVVWLIDVGAGCGELALLFARSSRVRLVHAIEPQAAAREALLRNLALNPGIDARKLVIHDRPAGRESNERLMRLDELNTPSGPGLVKIDVDGAELEVLGGARGFLVRKDVVWLIETHSAELERNCIEILSSQGLEACIIPNAWWRRIIPEHRPGAHNRWLWAQRG